MCQRKIINQLEHNIDVVDNKVNQECHLDHKEENLLPKLNALKSTKIYLILEVKCELDIYFHKTFNFLYNSNFLNNYFQIK